MFALEAQEAVPADLAYCNRCRKVSGDYGGKWGFECVCNAFNGLPMFGFDVIYADPPWPFENYSTKGESRNPNRHYTTMAIEQIQALQVGHLAAGNCALFLWVTDPMLDQAIDTIRLWGFRYVTRAFEWVKRTKLDTDWHMGTGYYTRANPESCLLATNGRVGRPADKGVRQLVVEPVREHSRKPDRIRDDIERMYPGKRYLELFARTQRPGWTSWGNQTDKFNEGGTDANSASLC